MLRYLRRLADRDYALDRGMIPLGSCTMKLNATTEMEPVTKPGFADMHPFAPADQFDGYAPAVRRPARRGSPRSPATTRCRCSPTPARRASSPGCWRSATTTAPAVTPSRDVCLIPASRARHQRRVGGDGRHAGRRRQDRRRGRARSTSPTCAAKIAQHADTLAAIMVTYPSTHGVFEEHIGEVCALVHDAGGQVYVDGANLNAMVGRGPSGPVRRRRLAPEPAQDLLHPARRRRPGRRPDRRCARTWRRTCRTTRCSRRPDRRRGSGAIAAAPWGSAAILPITWAYIRMMGAGRADRGDRARRSWPPTTSPSGSTSTSRCSTPARDGLVAHECILDLRGITRDTGVTVDDVAKRLIDYGFHAPTMSFPVAGTLMVEPTESEDLRELDRFVDAMIAIKGEIDRVGGGGVAGRRQPAAQRAAHRGVRWPASGSTRTRASSPSSRPASTRASKYWPPVRRIDGAFGDRNLVCACPPVDAYA